MRGTHASMTARRKKVAKLHPTTPLTEIAELLGVKKSTIHKDCIALGLKKTPEQRSQAVKKSKAKARVWTPELAEVFELMYPGVSNRALAEFFGMSAKAIESYAAACMLHKSKRSELPPELMPLKPKRVRVPKPKPKPAPKPVALAAPIVAKPDARLMSATQPEKHIAARESTRIRYTPETMPAKALAFFAPMSGIPDLSYRGQVARN